MAVEKPGQISIPVLLSPAGMISGGETPKGHPNADTDHRIHDPEKRFSLNPRAAVFQGHAGGDWCEAKQKNGTTEVGTRSQTHPPSPGHVTITNVPGNTCSVPIVNNQETMIQSGFDEEVFEHLSDEDEGVSSMRVSKHGKVSNQRVETSEKERSDSVVDVDILFDADGDDDDFSDGKNANGKSESGGGFKERKAERMTRKDSLRGVTTRRMLAFMEGWMEQASPRDSPKGSPLKKPHSVSAQGEEESEQEEESEPE